VLRFNRDVLAIIGQDVGKLSRVGDANRIKKWLETHAAVAHR